MKKKKRSAAVFDIQKIDLIPHAIFIKIYVAICVVLVFIAAFLTAFEFDKKITLDGWVSSKNEPARVYSHQNGVVQDIFVSEGQFVENRDKLMLIRSFIGDEKSGENSVLSKLNEQLVELGIQRKNAKERHEYMKKKNVLLADTIKRNIASENRKLTYEQSRASIIEQQIEATSKLGERGFVSPSTIDELRIKKLDTEMNVLNVRKSISEMQTTL